MARRSKTEVRVGPQGRIVIPAAIKTVLGLVPGDTLTARVEDGRLVLEKRENVLKRLRARYAAIPPGVSLVEDLLAERRAEAQREEER